MERDAERGNLRADSFRLAGRTEKESKPLQLAQIRVADRLRLALDEATVATIAASMAELGLQSPVLLRPWRAAGPEGSDAWGREDAGLFALVAGAHRLEAARRLGWTHIEALIVEGTPDEVRLIEIDENLARAELTVLDRARFLAARKRIHERMYPAQHRGGDRKSIDYAGENQSAKFALRSFSHDAMAHTGLSRRAVYRAVEIGKGLDDQAAADLAGTGLVDREGDLHALSRMPASKQRVIAAICRDALDRLEAAGMPQPHAEAVVRGQVHLLHHNLASKADIEQIRAQVATSRLVTKAEIAAVRGDVEKLRLETNASIALLRQETKAEIAAVRGDVEKLRLETKANTETAKNDIVKWIVTMGLAIVGILAGLAVAVIRLI